MITIILVRHAERERGSGDRELPLTAHGAEQAEKFGRRLFELCDRPTRVLTSSFKHARQTAELMIRGAGFDPSQIHGTAALTPERAPAAAHWADDQLYADMQEALAPEHPVILLVGHETRLSQLILRFTGERRRQLNALEAACVEAEGWQALWLGRGKVAWRYPVRNWLEQELVEKIGSKMTVATFLASANFIGLMELLIGQRDLLETSVFFWGALIAQFIAAGLFITTVYLYDQLVMPGGFWLLKPPRWIKREDEAAEEKLALDGYVQAHMIRIWSRFFTPAVALSMVGVLCLLAAWTWTSVLVAVLISSAIVWRFTHASPAGDVD